MTALAPVPQRRPRAFIYGRLSVAKDASNYRHNVETPIERQVRDILDWCRRENVEDFKSYADDGYSGWTGKRRPNFEELLSDVEALAEPGDVVVCWKLDRLTRNRKDLHRLWETCETAGVRLVSVTQGLDSAAPMVGELLTSVLGLMAKWEVDNTSERVKNFIKADKAAAERDGRLWNWGRRPFGWTPGGIAPLTQEAVDVLKAESRLTWTVKRKPPGGGPRVEVETPIVPEADYVLAAGLRLADGDSLRSIQMDWAAQGILTTTGHPWDTGSLRKVMLAPRNEAVLGPDLHALVRAILTDPARRKNRGSDRVHLLSGTLDCGACQNQLKSHVSQRVAPEYVCPSGLNSNGRRGCGRVCRSTESVDELVKGDLFYRLGCLKVEAALASAPADDGQRALLAEQQAKDARYKQLAERLGDRQANPDIDIENDSEAAGLMRAMDKLKVRLLEIEPQLASKREQTRQSRSPLLKEALKLAEHREKLEAFWDSLDVQQRHDLLVVAGFVRGRLSPGKPRARHLDPFTFERRWRKWNGDVESRWGLSPGSQAQPPRTRAESAAEQQGRYICQCGCGRPILLRPHHFNKGASVPGLIRGHNPGGWSTKRRSSRN
jgi:DNA invertase Pin-like site-specific DNA recombinase